MLGSTTATLFRYSLELVGMNLLLRPYHKRTWRVPELDSNLAHHFGSPSQFSGWCPHASGTGSEVGA